MSGDPNPDPIHDNWFSDPKYAMTKADTDAIERALRDAANGLRDLKSDQGDYGLCDDAADTIADLRNRVAVLTEALEKVANGIISERSGPYFDGYNSAQRISKAIARQALSSSDSRGGV